MPRRPFDFRVKTVQECWERAPCVPGRDPDRWRQNVLGRPVFKSFRSRSPGLCSRQLDHIVAPPKDKQTDSFYRSASNAQILSTKVNNWKRNKNPSREELLKSDNDIVLTDGLLDLIEMSTFGNLKNEKSEIIARCYTTIEMDKGKLIRKTPPCIVPAVCERMPYGKDNNNFFSELLMEIKSTAEKIKDNSNKSEVLAKLAIKKFHDLQKMDAAMKNDVGESVAKASGVSVAEPGGVSVAEPGKSL